MSLSTVSLRLGSQCRVPSTPPPSITPSPASHVTRPLSHITSLPCSSLRKHVGASLLGDRCTTERERGGSNKYIRKFRTAKERLTIMQLQREKETAAKDVYSTYVARTTQLTTFLQSFTVTVTTTPSRVILSPGVSGCGWSREELQLTFLY